MVHTRTRLAKISSNPIRIASTLEKGGGGSVVNPMRYLRLFTERDKNSAILGKIQELEGDKCISISRACPITIQKANTEGLNPKTG